MKIKLPKYKIGDILVVKDKRDNQNSQKTVKTAHYDDKDKSWSYYTEAGKLKESDVIYNLKESKGIKDKLGEIIEFERNRKIPKDSAIWNEDKQEGYIKALEMILKDQILNN